MTVRRRSGNLATVLASMAVLAGLPVLLAVAAGWPLPRALPTWAEVSQALADGWRPEGATLFHAVAALAWVAWVQLAANTLLELAAQLRSRPGPALTVPLSGWCRPFAVRFATAAVTLVGVLGPRLAPAVALPVQAGAVAPITAPAVVPPPAPNSTMATSRESAEAASSTDPVPAGACRPAPALEEARAVAEAVHLVRPGDSLWRLAERHLGDPLRWRELWDLNQGRPQPDGRQFRDPNLLRPGWRIALPAAPAATTQVHSVGRSASAAPTEPALRRSGEIVPTTTLAGPGEPGAPSRAPVVPGSVVPAAAETPTVAPPPPGPPSVPDRASTANTVAAGEPTPSRRHPPARPAPFTAGVPHLVAGAVIGYLAALLTRRERWRHPGHRFPKPTPELTDAERQVRAVADPDAPTTIDLALRHLAAALSAAPEHSVPGVLAIRCGPLGLEVLLREPVTSAPGQFELGDDGHSWRLAPDIAAEELAALAGDQPPPLPALVSIGSTPDGSVLIDLATIGCLGVTGDRERVEATFRSIALELATTPWAAGVTLVLVGGDSRLAALERVRVIDPAEALDTLRSCLRPGHAHKVGLAAAVDTGLVSPTVALVAADALDPESLGALTTVATPGSGLVVITAGAISTGAVLLLGSDSARLEPPGLDLDALPDPMVTDALVTLVGDAASPGGDVPDPEEVPLAARSPARRGAEGEEQLAEPPGFMGGSGPEPLVWVRVLGPVTVEWRHAASRPQLTELLAFIATHPPRIGADSVRLALWPVDPDDEHFGERSPSTLWTLVSKARLALGTDPDGGDLLITLPGNVYELSPLVACDWVRFETLRKRAADEPERSVPLLREALRLVRGRPFQDIPVGSYSWVGLDRLDSDMAAAIAEGAGTLVAAALAIGDLTTARYAVEQGRLGAPHSEGLIRSAMRVCAAAGDRDGLDRALRDARRLAQLLDATGEPEPETLRLYEELRRS